MLLLRVPNGMKTMGVKLNKNALSQLEYVLRNLDQFQPQRSYEKKSCITY